MKAGYKMKRLVSLVLAVLMVMALLTACSAPDSSTGTFDPSQLKTMKDVFAASGGESNQEGFTETDYVYVMEVDGVYYRAVAKLPKDVSEKIWEIEFDDAKRDKKVKDLVSPLEVISVENLSEQIPPQEELDKLIGKTGQELFDDGWGDNWYYDLEDMTAGLNHGPFGYNVKFEYDGEPMENTDDFDFYEAFKDLKVASVTYEGLGDATNLE